MSLTCSGAPAGFSAAGNGVAFSGPTAFRPPSSAGLAVTPGVMISTPMELPLAAGALDVLPCTLVTTADPEAAPASAAGTSWSCRGAAGGASGGAAAALASGAGAAVFGVRGPVVLGL